MLANRDKMGADVATMNAFMEKRYLGRKEVPDAAMEIQDYTDRMMRDMGLRVDRKRMRAPKSWWSFTAWKEEWFKPYMPRDYAGVVNEFLEQAGRKGRETRACGSLRFGMPLDWRKDSRGGCEPRARNSLQRTKHRKINDSYLTQYIERALINIVMTSTLSVSNILDSRNEVTYLYQLPTLLTCLSYAVKGDR